MPAPLVDRHIAVLMGGPSSEREVSLTSGKACADALERQFAKVTRVDAGRDVAQVLSALAEGLDIAAAERIFGYRHTTITTWLTRAGEHSTTLQDCFLQNLHLPHLQCDE